MENINIFEGAKFGDKFLTRDGRVVIFYYKDKHNAYAKFVTFINNECQDLITLLPNGNYCLYENPNDIVSKYQEPINEQELDQLANKEYPDFIYRNLNMSNKSHRDAFKAGYRKAMEE